MEIEKQSSEALDALEQARVALEDAERRLVSTILNSPRAELEHLRLRISELEAQNEALQMRPQAVAEKFREKLQAASIELAAAQRGLTSGCGCPIGKCMRKFSDRSSCWMQWAAAWATRTYMENFIGELVRKGNHPSRFSPASQFSDVPVIPKIDSDGGK